LIEKHEDEKEEEETRLTNLLGNFLLLFNVGSGGISMPHANMRTSSQTFIGTDDELIALIVYSIHTIDTRVDDPHAFDNPRAHMKLSRDDSRGGGGRKGYPAAGVNLGSYPYAVLSAEWTEVGLERPDLYVSGTNMQILPRVDDESLSDCDEEVGGLTSDVDFDFEKYDGLFFSDALGHSVQEHDIIDEEIELPCVMLLPKWVWDSNIMRDNKSSLIEFSSVSTAGSSTAGTSSARSTCHIAAADDVAAPQAAASPASTETAPAPTEAAVSVPASASSLIALSPRLVIPHRPAPQWRPTISTSVFPASYAGKAKPQMKKLFGAASTAQNDAKLLRKSSFGTPSSSPRLPIANHTLPSATKLNAMLRAPGVPSPRSPRVETQERTINPLSVVSLQRTGAEPHSGPHVGPQSSRRASPRQW
jgi:hypothetical protein